MKVTYKAINNGPSQYQTVTVDIPYEIAISGANIVKQFAIQKVKENLKPNGWIFIESEGQTIEIEPCP